MFLCRFAEYDKLNRKIWVRQLFQWRWWKRPPGSGRPHSLWSLLTWPGNIKPHNCTIQTSNIYWLSSTFFPCSSSPFASVTSPLLSTIWCFRPFKPYISCEDMIHKRPYNFQSQFPTVVHCLVWFVIGWDRDMRFGRPSISMKLIQTATSMSAMGPAVPRSFVCIKALICSIKIILAVL